MKVLVLLLFFWLGVAFTHGKRKREPRNCGRGGTLSITSLQPQGRNENQWAVGYHGNMFRAVVSYDHVHKITWKVEYGDRNENYVFNWEDWDTGYIASIENTRNGAFKASKPKVDTENEKAESTISVNKATNIDQVKLTFTTDHVEACSITNIIFKKCQTEHPLLVDSSSSTFSSGGNFYCDKGFDLFPINQNTRTSCSANGKWINSHEFKCYRAPNDTHIVGNLMIKEHEKMEIYCKFTQTTPPASKSKIFFGNQTFEKSLNKLFIRNITIEDDGKMIWCQPVSSYTKIAMFSEKGKSPTRQLRVLFAPKSINHDSNLTCDWIIGNDGNSCDFTFLSRPSADNISLFLVKNESDVKVEFKFSNSSLGRNQTITITQIENNHLSSQRFRLQVISSLFPESLLTFPFDLNIKRNVYSGETQPKILKSSQVTIIIGIVAGAIVIILLISLVFVIKRRKMRNNNGALSNEAVAEDRINDIYETADDVRGGNSVREERCNVIYNSGFTGTKDEAVREERCNIIYEGGDYGAEEKVNPLYGAALNQVPTKKTSNKNKHQATSNSYKQNLHSLNESDHVYASVVESKTTKKKKKKTSIQNHQNINDSEQTYASVDVTKKKKKELKHKNSPKTNQNLNDSTHYAPADLSQEKKTKLKRETTLQDHPSVTDSAQLYSSIDTFKKKANKNVPATSESLNDSDQLYASVDVSKKTGNNLR